MSTLAADRLRQFASDPAAFEEFLTIPSGHGPQRFGGCMVDFQRERFGMINPALLAAARGEKPDKSRFWWEATKGASKDSDLAVCLLWLLAFTARPLQCQIGAADKDQADELRKAALGILRLNPWLATRVAIQNWCLRCDATDSVCDIIPADTWGSHGSRPDVLIINELSHIPNETFAMNLMDNAAKVPRGLVVIATNAGHIGTWQQRWRQTAIDSDRWCFHKYDQPAPWLDPAEIEEAQLRNPSHRFRRLWQGVWSSEGGDCLSTADIQAAIDPELRSLDGADKQRRNTPYEFVAGLDLGTRRDHSALVVLGANRQTGRIRLASCESWAPGPGGQSVDLLTVKAATFHTAKRFGCVVIYDPWQCEAIAQELRSNGIGMLDWAFSGKNLNLMATCFLQAFTSRIIDLYDDRSLIRDLERLNIVERQFGFKLEPSRDEHGHGDRAMAMAICLPAAMEFASQPPVVSYERFAGTLNQMPSGLLQSW